MVVWMRVAYLIAGLLFVALAAVGVLVPIMPTTIFLILAAAAFARSSPRLEAWLLQNPHFGPPIQRWRERGAIAPTAKAMALVGMAAGYAIFMIGTRPAALYAAVVAVALAASAAYVVTRPDA